MNWTIRPTHPKTRQLSALLNVDELVAHLLANRGVSDERDAESFFNGDYERHLHNPFLFRDLPIIVERVRQAVAKKEIIGIFGDFDADGVTGSALLREALDGLGAKTVVHIPDKHREGHGVSEEGISVFIKAGAKFFFTVDCGITNIEEIASAKKRGLAAIIVDHHHIPEVLPDAIAVVNPKMPESGYPFPELCGAGTAFKVAQGLYRALAPSREEELKWLLDLAAIGTVADCMPIVGENRVIVKYGLVVLAKTRRVGLRELYKIARIFVDEGKPITTTTIGFQIAPRINAAGRMAHARIAHNLLVEKNREIAALLANDLDAHNRQRQKQTVATTDAVRSRAATEFSEKSCIVVADESYPLGIVGLVAGRVAEEFGKPAAIFYRDGEVCRGSFRSAGGINIIEIIEQCADLLIKFGGHSQAAGATVENGKMEEFSARFEDLVRDEMKAKKTEDAALCADAEILPANVSFDLVNILKKFEPFGLGNPEPSFIFRSAKIVEMRGVGSGAKHLKARFHLGDGAPQPLIDAIGFNLAEKMGEFSIGETADIFGSLQENIWNGNRSLQIQIADMRKEERNK